MKRIFIAAGFATALFTASAIVAPAFADCAGDMAKITDAMKAAKLDDAGTAKAKDLMTKATAAQTAKDEAACTASTAELMKMMGLKS